MKIFYYDLIAPSGLHTEFNSAMIKVLNNSFIPTNIEFGCERKHAIICQQKIEDKNVRFKPYLFLHNKMIGGFKTPLRDLISIMYVLRVFLASKKNDIVFFALVYPFALYFIYVLSKILRRNIYICIHGEIDIFSPNTLFNRNRKYYLLQKYVFTKKNNIKYIILGESIYKNIEYIFHPNNKIIVIDHPYIYNINNIPNLNFDPLVIGQIGSGDKGKGTHYLFRLAELLEEEIKQKKLKIKLIGKLNPQLFCLDNGLIEYSSTMLDSKDFQKGIQSLHYTLQLRDNTMGKAVASGSFLDTIKYEKPYFSLNNEYVRYYTEKYEKSGEIFENLEQMSHKIKEILTDKNNLSKYMQSIDTIKKMQQDFSINNIVRKLKYQIL